jgi:hypothetical protein
MLCVCVCVLVLVIWHANRIFSALHYIVICDLSGCTKFITLPQKVHDLWKAVTEHKNVF